MRNVIIGRWLTRFAIVVSIALFGWGIGEMIPVGTTPPDTSVQYCKSGLGDNSDWVWYCSKTPIVTISPSSR